MRSFPIRVSLGGKIARSTLVATCAKEVIQAVLQCYAEIEELRVSAGANQETSKSTLDRKGSCDPSKINCEANDCCPDIEAIPSDEFLAHLTKLDSLTTATYRASLSDGSGGAWTTLYAISENAPAAVSSPEGSQFAMKRLNEKPPAEECETLLRCLLPSMSTLAKDVFASQIVLKLFDGVGVRSQCTIAEQLVGSVLDLSCDVFGCRLVQRCLAPTIPLSLRCLLASELERSGVDCVEDPNGNHVVQKCVETLPAEELGWLLPSFVTKMQTLSTHVYGCRVVQRCLERCPSEEIEVLLEELVPVLLELCENQYGNYVMQHVIEFGGTTNCRRQLFQVICHNLLRLSSHKFASNVVEKALRSSSLEEKRCLAAAALNQNYRPTVGPLAGQELPPIVTMGCDRFANYVVQSLLNVAPEDQQWALVSTLLEHLPTLKKSLAGHHIVATLSRLSLPAASPDQSTPGAFTTPKDVDRGSSSGGAGGGGRRSSHHCDRPRQYHQQTSKKKSNASLGGPARYR